MSDRDVIEREIEIDDAERNPAPAEPEQQVVVIRDVKGLVPLYWQTTYVDVEGEPLDVINIDIFLDELCGNLLVDGVCLTEFETEQQADILRALQEAIDAAKRLENFEAQCKRTAAVWDDVIAQLVRS